METINEILRRGGVRCALLGDPGAACALVQPVDGRELAAMEVEAEQLRRLTQTPFLLAAFDAGEWNDALSPWPAPAVFRGRDFGGGAAATLDALLNHLMPAVAQRCPAPGRRWLLGGYSLAGLFALWASTRTDAFAGVAAVSPSVWFPGWLDYAREHPPRSPRVYLSLGDREERTRNPVMAQVGDAIRAQYALLRERTDCVLEWNPGNHFMEPQARTAKGFAWVMDGELKGEAGSRF